MTTTLPAYLSYPNPWWPRYFDQIATLVGSLTLPLPYSLEHVGSTSIPGMVAKPIIDVDLITQGDCLAEVAPALRAAGWEHSGDGGLSGRECFSIRSGSRAAALPAHHLYLCTAHGREPQRHLLFRDYLRAHPARAAWLSQMKLQLALDQALSREEYIRAKEPYVAASMTDAEAWEKTRLLA